MTAETDIARWADSRQLLPEWIPRSNLAATLIQPGSIILDLGCGAMSLEKFLPAGCQYIPCDVVRRDDRTIVCDFNKDGLPACDRMSTVTALGVLEYIADLPEFLRQLRHYGVPAVISYCPAEFSIHLDRARLGWVNHLRAAELEAKFRDSGFKVTLRTRVDAMQYLFRILPTDAVGPDEKTALVLSYKNVGNFGDRLGFHLLNDVLPAHVCVTHAHFDHCDVPEVDFDLVIVGIGNSIFAPLLTSNLDSLLQRASKSIGIFGTQFRSSINADAMARVVGGLDHWFARYEEDAEVYGAGRNNVSHLGDWLVNAFAMAHGDRPELLNVGDEVWNNLPLDRVIQDVQSYSRVHSTRLHPLLCALTSAWEVSYVEQRDAKGMVSGKFASMLRDVFDRSYPENHFFEVDRSAVSQYKIATRRRSDALRTFLSGQLM
jgi:hypothetical protein